MNIPHLTVLRDTLLNLPPEIHFDMNVGHNSHPCGTAACIAGVCYTIQHPAHAGTSPGWSSVRNLALDWLDLPDDRGCIGHPLFDFDLAPKGCTPQRAAEAVQNVMDNQSPWN